MYDSFIFYSSFHEACKDLSAEQYGKIMFVLNEYALNGEVPASFDDPIIKMAFTFMKPQIDANNARKEAGSKGGRPQNRKPMVIENDENTKPVVIENSENAKPMVIENDDFSKPNVNVNANVNVNEKEIAAEPAATSAKNKPTQKPKTEKTPLREREPENDYEKIEKAYLQEWDSLVLKGILKTPEPPAGCWTPSRALIKQNLEQGITVEQIVEAVHKASADGWILKCGFSLKQILSSSVLNRLVNEYKQSPDKLGGRLLENDRLAMEDVETTHRKSEENFAKFKAEYDSKGELSNDDPIW